MMVSKWLPFTPEEGSYLGFNKKVRSSNGVGYKSTDEKTFYWYTYEDYEGSQFNKKDVEYWYIAFF